MDKIEEFLKMKLYESEATKKNYMYHIQNYFSVVNYPIDTYFSDRSLEEIETDLITYWEYLVKTNKAPKTKIGKLSAMKIFMTYYNKEIKNLDIWDTFTNRLRGKNKTIMKEHVPDKIEIKNILNHCNCMISTAIVVSLSSGMRIGEVTQILPEDIFLNEKPARVNVRAEITKTGVRRTTFLSTEATELLTEWDRIRDDYLKNSLRTLNFKNLSYKRLERKNDKRIFPCKPQVIRRGFNRACDRCKYTDVTIMNGDDNICKNTGKKKARRSLHYHNLRKFFRTHFGNPDLAEVLLGHEGYLTSTYRQWNDKQLAEEYLKYEHNVSIYSVSPDLTELQNDKIEKDKLIKELQDRMERFEHLLTEKEHLLTLYKNQMENNKAIVSE